MNNLHLGRSGCARNSRLTVVAVQTVILLLVAVDSVRGQKRPEKVSDLFANLHQNLSEAADAQLAAIQAQPRPRDNRGSGGVPNMDFEGNRAAENLSHIFRGEGSGRTRLEPRFQSMGVDAERIFGEVGVPVEFPAIAQVESNFDPNAGAFGLWQLMPATARRYGLRVEANRDDRADPQKATGAAARYLRDLHAQFEDWLFALAAYNAGEDLVEKAVVRAQTTNFWPLSNARQLPKETRNYVSAVLAAVTFGDNSGAWLRKQHAAPAKSKSDVLFALFSAGAGR